MKVIYFVILFFFVNLFRNGECSFTKKWFVIFSTKTVKGIWITTKHFDRRNRQKIYLLPVLTRQLKLDKTTL